MPKPIEPTPNNAECERMLRTMDVGVLVMCQDDVPYAVPMNHAFAEGKLFFHCAPTGRKLDVLRANPQVCYVVEQRLGEGNGERCHADWESVIAYGTARVVESPEELRTAFFIFGRHYRPDFEVKESSLQTTRAIIMEVTSMTARREVAEQPVVYWSWSPTR